MSNMCVRASRSIIQQVLNSLSCLSDREERPQFQTQITDILSERKSKKHGKRDRQIERKGDGGRHRHRRARHIGHNQQKLRDRRADSRAEQPSHPPTCPPTRTPGSLQTYRQTDIFCAQCLCTFRVASCRPVSSSSRYVLECEKLSQHKLRQPCGPWRRVLTRSRT